MTRQRPRGGQLVEEGQPGAGSLDHRHGHGAVQPHHRVVGHPVQHGVQRADPLPVGVLLPWCRIVQRGDGSLQGVLADRLAFQRRGGQCGPFRDRRAVPPGAVLHGQGDEGPVGRDPGRPARLGQEHECEQTGYLGLVGQQLVEQASEADGFRRQVGAVQVGAAARRIALVEDEVDHPEHQPEPLGVGLVVGSANRSPDSAAVRLALLMRWAMVVSGTRKAAAISRVVRPPRARSVRATADAGDNAGWQHMKKRTSVSSLPGPRIGRLA